MSEQIIGLSWVHYRHWASVLTTPLTDDHFADEIRQFICNGILDLAIPMSSTDYLVRRNLMQLLLNKIDGYLQQVADAVSDLDNTHFGDEIEKTAAYKDILYEFFADIILDDFGMNDYLNTTKDGYRFNTANSKQKNGLNTSSLMVGTSIAGEDFAYSRIGTYLDNLVAVDFSHSYYYIHLGISMASLCKPDSDMPLLSFFRLLFNKLEAECIHIISECDIAGINVLYTSLHENLMRGVMADKNAEHLRLGAVMTANEPEVAPTKDGYILGNAIVFDKAVMLKTLADMAWDKDTVHYASNIEKRVQKSGGTKPVYILSNPQLLDQIIDCLLYEFPHFKEVIAVVKRNLILSILAKKPLTLPPMLLLGAAGIGKTTFMQRIGQELNIFSKVIHMESVSGNMSLSGMSTHWSGGHAGLFFETMLESNVANPIIMLDEIDKTSVQEKANPINSLYTVLEKSTASHFVDEAVPCPLDMSLVSWIATANKDMHIIERELGAAIVSRFSIFNIESPSLSDRLRIGQTMYYDFITQNGLQHILSEHLHTDVLNIVAAGSLREMRKRIELGCGSALEAVYKDADSVVGIEKLALTVKDVTPATAIQKAKMGFN